jgi:hypothetical protein
MGMSKARKAYIAKRRTFAIQMRLAGASWQQVADRLDYSSRGAACCDVGRALAQNLVEQNTTVEELRYLEVARLDRLQVAIWQNALNGDIRAVDAVARIIMHRSRTASRSA